MIDNKVERRHKNSLSEDNKNKIKYITVIAILESETIVLTEKKYICNNAMTI